MGKMKDFGFFLANLVYNQRLSDPEIIAIVKDSYSMAIDAGDDWIINQIKAVRKNPKVYRHMA